MKTTYIADLDLKGREMERPFLRVYVEGQDDAEALAAANLIADADEVVRRVVPLQPILDDVRARPGDFDISWKHEGREGPVHLTDRTKLPEQAEGERSVQFVPFGSQPEWDIPLPWSTRAEAKRLASYLGLSLATS